MDPFRMLGEASVPLALVVFGLSLAAGRKSTADDDRAPESPTASTSSDVALVAVLKMLVMPALAYAVARWGSGSMGTTCSAQVVIAALPTAQNVLVYAVRYQRGRSLARDSALVTTLASIPVITVIAVALG